MSETNVEGKYKSAQTGKRPRWVVVVGNILSKLSVLIDNNRAGLIVITLVVLYVSCGYVSSQLWFDKNASSLKFLSDKGEALAYLGALAAVMIPIWIEVVHLCNKNNLVGPVLHRVLQTKELLYTAVACLVLVLISPRVSYLYMPVILFTAVSFNLAYKYFMATYLPLKSSKKVTKAVSKITKNVLHTISISDGEIYVLSGDRKNGSLLAWDSSRERIPVRAYCDGAVIDIRLWMLRLLEWGLMRVKHCSVDIDVFYLSTAGCEVRSGDTVAMLFIDKPVGQMRLARAIAEHAFVIRKIEQVSTLDKLMNNFGDEMLKINNNTTRDELDRLFALYDAIESRYDKFLGGKFSSYIPVSADVKMFSYVSSFNSQTQNIGGRLSKILVVAAESSIKTGNLQAFSSLCSKVLSGYRDSIREENFIALSRYDRVCHEAVILIDKYSQDYTNENGCDYVYQRLNEVIVAPLYSLRRESAKECAAIVLNRITFLCKIGVLCVNLGNFRYTDLLEDIVEYIWSVANDDHGNVSNYAISALLSIQAYVLSMHKDISDLGGDRFWGCVNSRTSTLSSGRLTEVCIEMYDTGFIKKVVRDSGIRGIDLFGWEYSLRLVWLTLISTSYHKDVGDGIMKKLSAELSSTDFLAGGASEWEDSAIYMIIEKNATCVSNSTKLIIKEMTLERINAVQDNIKSMALDDKKIDDFCGSINDFVSCSEWVRALESNDVVNTPKVSSRMLSRSIYLDRRAFANKDHLPGCYEYSTHGFSDNLGRGIIDEISKYVFRYWLKHSQQDKSIPNIDDDLFNNNYIVLNGYAKWEIRRDYFEKAPASKRLFVRCSDLPSGLYIIPNDMVGSVRFKSPAGVYDNSQPVVVSVSGLGTNESAKEQFIQSKIEQGYSENEANGVVSIMLLLYVACIFEYYPAKKSGRKIIHIPEGD